MADVRLIDVRKAYGRTQVVHGVDLAVEDGELIVIVGPSGCGKSTLLRMVAGLETITAGEIRIGGRRVNECEPRERDIAMVFQNYALYPHMSVYGNMAYGLKIAGMDRSEIDRRVRNAAAMLELEAYLERKPRQLSGGQRQRVAMGRAIVRQPAVFLFDEPLSNLDAKLRVQMRIEIKTLQRDLGVTALYVTHDQVEAMTLADRMIVMNDGIAEQIGRPLEVYQNPSTTFVAGFIGSPPMNFFKTEQLPSEADGAAIVGIRPEHLDFTGEDGAMLCGEVTMIEPLGAETLAYIRIGDGSVILVRKEGETAIPPVSSRIGLKADSRRLHRFDEDGRKQAG